MATTNSKDQLLHTALGQIAICVGIALATWFYALPKYHELTDSVAAANSSIVGYTSMEQKGMTYEEIQSSLKGSPANQELLRITTEHPAETKAAINNTSKSPYLTWLRQSIDDKTEKDTLQNEMARLNSVLPSLSPINNGIEQNAISLKMYVNFIENNIIKAFGLESVNPVGIQNVRYGKAAGDNVPASIGVFDSEISFDATNDNIANMINYINTLWNSDILNGTGTTGVNVKTGALVSPLVTIEELSLQKNLDTTKPSEKNTGRVTLRFYVRGSSTTDITYLFETINKRKTTLKKSIDDAIAYCNTQTSCTKKSQLEVISRKYTEFTRSDATTKKRESLDGLYALGATLDTINAIEKELNTITGK